MISKLGSQVAAVLESIRAAHRDNRLSQSKIKEIESILDRMSKDMSRHLPAPRPGYAVCMKWNNDTQELETTEVYLWKH